MPNSDLLPISDFFPFTRSFNCDPYPIHVFTLAIPPPCHLHCCHLLPRVARFSQQNPPLFLLKTGPIVFQGGGPLLKIMFQGLNITLLESLQPN